MTTKTAPTKSDLKAAAELDAMAEQLCPSMSHDAVCALDDLAFGQRIAMEGASRQLRERAAALRGEKFYG